MLHDAAYQGEYHIMAAKAFHDTHNAQGQRENDGSHHEAEEAHGDGKARIGNKGEDEHNDKPKDKKSGEKDKEFQGTPGMVPAEGILPPGKGGDKGPREASKVRNKDKYFFGHTKFLLS
jgi:hypothetical protein